MNPRSSRVPAALSDLIAGHVHVKLVNEALASAEFKARFVDLGLEPYATSPAEFGKFIVDYTEKWGKVIRAANIKVQ
jgi:tripartite-type tricarboxylate transporter receptor subunit TctC